MEEGEALIRDVERVLRAARQRPQQELTQAKLHLLRHGNPPGFGRQGLGPAVGVEVGLARLASGQVGFKLADPFLAKGGFQVVGEQADHLSAGQDLALAIRGSHGPAS